MSKLPGAAWLEQPALGERHADAVADYDMVQHPNVHQGKRFDQPVGDHLVGLAGLSDAGGVIVREYDRRRIALQRQLDHLARVHARAVNGAAKQLIEADHAVPVVEAQAAEHLVGPVPQLCLDNRHRVISFDELFRGTIDGASVHPREVVKLALERNAAAIILAHNHPSGVAEPSQADEMITRRLVDALALVDIRVLDHIVVGDCVCVSFVERGLL